MVGPQDFLLSEEDGCPLASNLVLEKTLLLAIPPEALHYLRLKTSRAIMAVQDIIVV
jgi:cupin superfamily acireductone dioxygenase involved in methionine salvage